jgi:glucose/arabinose dehydrogenase
MRLLGLLLLLSALLSACAGESAREAASTPSPTPSPAEISSPVPPAEGRRPSSPPVRTSGDEPRVEVIAGGLEVPWDVAFLPDGRALVTERPGRIRLLSRKGAPGDEPVAQIEVQAEGEGGLMGLDLDPDFGSRRPFAYVMLTAGGEVRVQRLRWDGRRLTPESVVLDGITAGSIHDSGRLRFGPDDRLYIATGDAGDGELAQDPESRNGKILALNPRQYRGSGPARPSVVSTGHRNPQGLDWQPGTDRLFATEHGPSGFDGPSCCDELNAIQPGGDYAWPRFGEDQPAGARPAKLWQETIAPSGMAFVSRGDSAWTGDVLVAALRGTALHRLSVSGRTATEEEVLLDGRYGRLRAVVEAPDGAIWVTTSNLDTYGQRQDDRDDRILRVIPPRG